MGKVEHGRAQQRMLKKGQECNDEGTRYKYDSSTAYFHAIWSKAFFTLASNGPSISNFENRTKTYKKK